MPIVDIEIVGDATQPLAGTLAQRSRTIRYSAVVKDGTWTEVGDRIVPGKDPVRFFEMKLRRIGDSDWPGAGAISPQ